MFYKGMKNDAMSQFETEVSRYNGSVNSANQEAEKLGQARSVAARELIPEIEEWINSFPSRKTPYELEKALKKLKVTADQKAIDPSKLKWQRVTTNLDDAGRMTGVGTAATAGGVGIATAAPSALLALATTFGSASTGTAISSLSGAAATNAALAWLGGGALAAGGGGVGGGSALIAFASGPVGWIAGGLIATGGTVWAIKKARRAAEEFVAEATRRESELRQARCGMERFELEAEVLTKTTTTCNDGVRSLFTELRCLERDVFAWSRGDQHRLGILINSVEALDRELQRDIVLC